MAMIAPTLPSPTAYALTMARTLGPAELPTTHVRSKGEQVNAGAVVRNKAKYLTAVDGTNASRMNPIAVRGVRAMITRPRLLKRSEANEAPIQTQAAKTYGGTVSSCACVVE